MDPTVTSRPGSADTPAVTAPVGERPGGRCAVDRSPLGTFSECPHCGSALAPEHAHFRCTGCGWRDSCCD